MPADPPILDPIDAELVRLLVADARASFAELGKQVGLSPHGAADRVRRLRRNGVISGFTAIVEPASIGRGLDAFIDVRLAPSTSSDAFESFALALAAVREVAFVTGRYDFELRVACEGPEDLDRTVRAIRREGGAAATETRIIMRATASAQPLS